jgi:V-type H+-transporting ATPase subunit F
MSSNAPQDVSDLLEEEQGLLIAVIGDEDTVTGFLLAGVGQRDSQGANFLVVDAKTTKEGIEAFYTGLITRGDVGLVIMNASIANQIRSTISANRAPIPMVLEIPSKDAPYDPKNDALMKRVLQMLGEA